MIAAVPITVPINHNGRRPVVPVFDINIFSFINRLKAQFWIRLRIVPSLPQANPARARRTRLAALLGPQGTPGLGPGCVLEPLGAGSASRTQAQSAASPPTTVFSNSTVQPKARPQSRGPWKLGSHFCFN